MTSFAERVAAALDTNDAQESGRRIHQVVQTEVRSLDTTATVELTGYFNHSVVPDVMVKWRNGSSIEERPVFLRHSLRSSRASGDLDRFDHTDQKAIFVSLAQDEPEEDTALIREVAAGRAESRVLVTTVPALDELSRDTVSSDPVLGLVRSSVVRSARGAVIEDDVEKLILPRERRIQAADLQTFSATVTAAFTEDAAVRINRMVRIVEQALAEEPDPRALITSGVLSESEMRELIPYLLQLEGVTRSHDFWVSLATLINLPDIEPLWTAFDGLDLTPLASAGSGHWQARRLQLAQRSDAIDDERHDGTPRWTVVGRLLAAEVGNWRLTFAHQGTKLKTTGRDAPPARWEDLRPSLEPYKVTAVDLSGVLTKSQYGARESVDMKNRIAAFIESADDSFHVPSVMVETGADDTAADIKADFSEMMLFAEPTASLAVLTRVALGILGYRYPPDSSDIDQLLGGDRTGESDGHPTDPDIEAGNAPRNSTSDRVEDES